MCVFYIIQTLFLSSACMSFVRGCLMRAGPSVRWTAPMSYVTRILPSWSSPPTSQMKTSNEWLCSEPSTVYRSVWAHIWGFALYLRVEREAEPSGSQLPVWIRGTDSVSTFKIKDIVRAGLADPKPPWCYAAIGCCKLPAMHWSFLLYSPVFHSLALSPICAFCQFIG